MLSDFTFSRRANSRNLYQGQLIHGLQLLKSSMNLASKPLRIEVADKREHSISGGLREALNRSCFRSFQVQNRN